MQTYKYGEGAKGTNRTSHLLNKQCGVAGDGKRDVDTNEVGPCELLACDRLAVSSCDLLFFPSSYAADCIRASKPADKFSKDVYVNRAA